MYLILTFNLLNLRNSSGTTGMKNETQGQNSFFVLRNYLSSPHPQPLCMHCHVTSVFAGKVKVKEVKRHCWMTVTQIFMDVISCILYNLKGGLFYPQFTDEKI